MEPINGATFLHQVYTAAQADYSGRVTVPILWDRERRTIVNNESSEIIRMLTSAFDEVGAAQCDYYPAHLRAEIDAANARVYDGFNNGVYKAGFATNQAAYDEAVAGVFETLDWLEDRLSRQRYLVGGQLSEADIRLFTTLVRFDEVYNGHFKCNVRRIVDYPNLWSFTREIFQLPGVAATVNMEHIKRHYYESHRTINPTSVVPAGPASDFAAPHDRTVIGPFAPGR
ncbi:Glutathione S-transferase, N-terminal domain [Sphingobium faniae]|nr:Glutathione S-transferase, N-terminal domain [Sphingobium faniae]